MNKINENNLIMGKFLVLFLICGVSFAFGANDVLAGAKSGFFTVLGDYVVPLVVFFTLVGGIGMVVIGIDWKWALGISFAVIAIWVAFSDVDTLTNSIKATQTLVRGWFR